MAKAVTIYGIKNCDTMKKARAWLDKPRRRLRFHDYKTEGVERAQLEGWARKAGWGTVLNRAGMTVRKLPAEERDGLNEEKAIGLMLAQPSMIKRPVLELGGGRSDRLQAGGLCEGRWLGLRAHCCIRQRASGI